MTEHVSEDEKHDEKWESFAPEHPETNARRFRRLLTHEWTLAALGSLVLAVLLTWPTAAHLASTIPQDTADPMLQAWQIAWGGHALVTDPANFWNANAFYPEKLSLAFTDAMPGYAPLGILGSGFAASVARYNIVFILLHALAFFGGYVLVRQLGARRPGALVAGMAFAYAPWRLGHGGHMNVISTGGIALALAMLARGHGFSLKRGYEPGRIRLGWVIAGWVVAAWQISLGFATGIPFGYVLLLVGIVSVIAWLTRGRPAVPRKILFGDLGGGALFAAVTLLLTIPYLKVLADHPNAARGEDNIPLFSPPLRGLLTAPGENWLWGEAHTAARQAISFPPEMALLPGFILLGLALSGLFFSSWALRTRLWLGGATLVTAYLALGTQAWGDGEFGYLLLYRHLPGMDALRTPGRMMLWTVLLLAVLAAGAVSAFGDQVYAVANERAVGRPGIPLRLAMFIPVLLVGVESLNVTPHPEVPQPPAAMRTAKGPLMLLPSDQFTDEAAMLWSADNGFTPMVNGGSAFAPDKQDEARKATAGFPSAESVDYLRALGVKTVIVLRGRIVGTPWESAATASGDGLGLTRTEVGGDIVFQLG